MPLSQTPPWMEDSLGYHPKGTQLDPSSYWSLTPEEGHLDPVLFDSFTDGGTKTSGIMCGLCLQMFNASGGITPEVGEGLADALLQVAMTYGSNDVQNVSNMQHLGGLFSAKCSVVNYTCVPFQIHFPYKFNVSGVRLTAEALQTARSFLSGFAEQNGLDVGLFEWGSGEPAAALSNTSAIAFSSSLDQLPTGQIGDMDTLYTSGLATYFDFYNFLDEVLYKGADDDVPLRSYDHLLDDWAIKQLDAWAGVKETMKASYGAGTFFFVLGLFLNFGLFVRYLNKVEVSSYDPGKIWRDTSTATFVGFLGVINGAAFTALTQTKDGYFTVRRDAAFVHFLGHCLCLIAVAGAAVAALDCGERPCQIDVGGHHADFFPVFFLVVTVPLAIGQLVNAVLCIVLRLPKAPVVEVSQEELDEIEPKIPDFGSASHWRTVWISLTGTFILNLFQLLAVIGMFFNTTSYNERTYVFPLTDLGRRGPIYVTPEEERGDVPGDWGFNVPDGHFGVALTLWLLGLFANAGAVVAVVGGGTRSLAKRQQTHPIRCMIGFALGLLHPEYMMLAVDRQADAKLIRQLGGLPALLVNFPLFLIFFFGLFIFNGGSSEPFVFFFSIVLAIHTVIWGIRAMVVGVTKRMVRPSEPAPPLACGDKAMIFVSVLQVILFTMLALVCITGKGKGSKCKLPFEATSGELGSPWAVDDDNMTMTAYNDACETVLTEAMTGSMVPYFLFMAFILAMYGVANLGVSFSFLNHFEFSHADISDYSFRSATIVIFAIFEPTVLKKFAQTDGAELEVKRASMFVSLFWLGAVLIVHVAQTFLTRIDFGALEGTIFDAGPTAAFAFIFAVIAAIAKLLMFTVLQTTRKNNTVIQDGETEFHHTLFCCGSQWAKNRQVPPEFAATGAAATPTRRRTWTHDESEAVDVGNGACRDMYAEGYPEGGYTDGEGYADGGYADEGYADGGYAEGYGGEYGEGSYAGEAGGDEQYVEGGAGQEEVLEAICLRKAIFMMPDGRQGVFCALPTSEDQPVPFLFVQAVDVRPIKNKLSKRNAQVAFTFNSADVGGLDAEFVQQNVSNNPEAAWRMLEELDGGADGYAQDDQGYGQEAPLEHTPAEDEPPPEPDYAAMTPRTLAAQRL